MTKHPPTNLTDRNLKYAPIEQPSKASPLNASWNDAYVQQEQAWDHDKTWIDQKLVQPHPRSSSPLASSLDHPNLKATKPKQ